MKKNITLLFTLLLTGLAGFSQSEECNTKISLFHEDVRADRFDQAYDNWMFVRTNCPDANLVTYIDGEKILEHKIEKAASNADKKAFIEDLMKLYDERMQYFADKTEKGKFQAMSCQLMYDNREVLGKTDLELYECFDAAYNADKATFTNPKSLYTYFSLMVDLYDAGQKPAEDLFNKYDDVAEKIEEEVKINSEKLNDLIEKEEAGTELTRRDIAYKRQYEIFLRAFDQVSGSMDGKLGSRANCENLIPLYEKNFEANKTNAVWLQRAAAKMSEKECTGDPLFFKLVNALHELNPSANSAYYLGILKDREGKSGEAIEFYEQAISLQTDDFEKAKLYSRIAGKLKASGNFSKARSYYKDALKFNPSNGRPYLEIADMYAKSANNCGDTAFNKRAVYWLAAEEARKAGRVDPTLAGRSKQYVDSYMGRAPSKSEVFTAGVDGQTINIGCWIGASVTVPNL